MRKLKNLFLSPSVNECLTHGGKYVEKQMAAFYSVNITAAATTDSVNRLKNVQFRPIKKMLFSQKKVLHIS